MEKVKDQSWPNELILASPRGFCAGVIRAIEALKKVQANNPNSTIYSYHQIIHNTHVVREFEESGVKFIDSIDEAPEGSKLVFSAHGVSPEIRIEAAEKKLSWVDATCPLVDKTHREAKKFIEQGYTILYIGHAGHDETVGTLGEAPESIRLIQTEEDTILVDVLDPEKIALITQTTLSMDDTALIRQALRKRFPNIIEPPKSDICYATQNRQDGVKQIIQAGAQVIVVVGSSNSSNSQRLREVAEECGAIAFLVDDAVQLMPEPFFGLDCVGLTAGASVPNNKFQEALDWFKKRGSQNLREVIAADESKIAFAPPQQLPR